MCSQHTRHPGICRNHSLCYSFAQNSTVVGGNSPWPHCYTWHLKEPRLQDLCWPGLLFLETREQPNLRCPRSLLQVLDAWAPLHPNAVYPGSVSVFSMSCTGSPTSVFPHENISSERMETVLLTPVCQNPRTVIVNSQYFEQWINEHIQFQKLVYLLRKLKGGKDKCVISIMEKSKRRPQLKAVTALKPAVSLTDLSQGMEKWQGDCLPAAPQISLQRRLEIRSRQNGEMEKGLLQRQTEPHSFSSPFPPQSPVWT